MKVNKSDVDKIIKEEFQKMMKKKELTSKLSQINEEIAKMESEDASLNEVEAGGETKVSSHGWTGEANGDVKFKPKFEKIGTHLKEEDEVDAIEMDADTDMDSDMGASMGAEEEVPMGEFEAKFAEIGKAIDAKLSAEMSGMGAKTEMPTDVKDDMGAEMDGASDDEFEEVEVSDDNTEGTDEIEEYHELVGGVGAEQGMTANDATKSKEVRESVDEPLEGHSVAQEVAADDVNDNMEKDTHVKESADTKGTVISEGKSTSKNIFTEGLDANKAAKMLAEFNRMKKFAGLTRDEE